ncbi:hypothetical protein DL96DRAFT_1810022 [Flagelloscypha sp. PMI_526]|nr:hypothetical protein DL96DRAFT_1810022 [Flagelloscypha sp. PMI_526]
MGPPRPKKRRTRNGSDESDLGGVQFEPESEASSDSGVEILHPTQPSSSPKKKSRVVVDSDSDDNIQIYTSSNPKRRVPQASRTTSGPRKKRRLARERPKHTDSDDEDDLSRVAPDVLEDRFRDRTVKTARQKKLEKYTALRKRKIGPSTSSAKGGDITTSDDEDTQDAEATDHNSLFSEDSDVSNSSSSDFIEEDDNAAVELPAEYRQVEDLVTMFKKVFQFFVHVAARDPDERRIFMQDQLESEDVYFALPYRALQKKLSGTRDSLVASSIWPPDFRGPLETYPGLSIVDLKFAERGCNACKLSSRISTKCARVSGMRYDYYGFQDIESSSSSSSDEDSESDSDESERRSKKRKKKMKEKERKRKKKGKRKRTKGQDTENRAEFKLGRFCARRAAVFHQFCHWEYDLFQAILEKVDEIRERPSSKKAAMKKGPSIDSPDSIVQHFDDRKFIDRQWRLLRAMMDEAHNLDAASKRGERDRDVDS